MNDAERTPGIPPEEEPCLPFEERHLPKARVSDELLHVGRDRRPGRVQRADGWTPERIRVFLHALAACGVVSDAARAAGMSVRSAYYLRSRAEGGPFNIAWNAAHQLARRRLADAAFSRAIHGEVEVIVRDGVVWGERHRYDNRLTLGLLTRLDKLAEANDDESRAARFVIQEFDQFVEIICRGGAGAVEFIAAREQSECRPSLNDAARNLERLDNYRRYGAGLPDEIDVSDLDPAAIADWTEEQKERAERAGLIGEIAGGSDGEPEPDEAIDPDASLSEADQAEALRRYYRWKDAADEAGTSDE